MLTKIDISKSLAISGWMTEPELVWLAQQAHEHRCIVEIGSHLGRSTRALLDNTEGIVYACDDWKGPRDVYMSKKERDGLYVEFQKNVQDHITSGKCRVIKADHSLLRKLQQATDMVFIDGGHEYENVKEDLLIWKDRVGKRGLLCGHDAHMTDVQQAILEILGEVEVAEGTTIWYTQGGTHGHDR